MGNLLSPLLEGQFMTNLGKNIHIHPLRKKFVNRCIYVDDVIVCINAAIKKLRIFHQVYTHSY